MINIKSLHMSNSHVRVVVLLVWTVGMNGESMLSHLCVLIGDHSIEGILSLFVFYIFLQGTGERSNEIASFCDGKLPRDHDIVCYCRPITCRNGLLKKILQVRNV